MYYGWTPYVPVEKKLSRAKALVKKKLGNKANPIEIEGRQITKTFWGTAWCEHLETYSDFSNRMPRGRTYVRNGSVVHLEIAPGVIKSYVAGSQTYKIVIKIDPLKPARWKEIKTQCSGEIGSVVELLQGKLSKHVLSIVTNKEKGLFPLPKEIHFDCSCPDWADMCKHVAATLYGVGALLDKSPELFFKLRGVDHLELIDSSVSIATGRKDTETLEEEHLEEIFGLELADSLEPTVEKKPIVKNITETPVKKKPVAKKKTTVKKKKTTVKKKTTPKKKTTVQKKSIAKKAPPK
ncbi:MAG: hypothetical protein LBG58_10735 [Planctomycetaceae bacterium]|jgi:uncharacterized Zn finger protein|nr:hypothetical protein [Planctomycetaceae bacterium]